MSDVSWKIYWNEYTSDVYLHGTRIYPHAFDHVEFHNDLMPPGTVIKTWYSKVNFQRQKIEPALPMIDGESKYRIHVDMETEGQGSCLVRLVFYDRYETEAGSLIVRDTHMDFQCPLKTYSYQMQLINGGITALHYHYITIEELDESQEETEERV